jgi:hypothetical protein
VKKRRKNCGTIAKRKEIKICAAQMKNGEESSNQKKKIQKTVINEGLGSTACRVLHGCN